MSDEAMQGELSGRSEADYHMDFAIIGAAYRLLKAVPLDDMRSTVERAHSVGPFLDPTAYRRGMKSLDAQKTAIDAAIAFRNAIDRLIPTLPVEVRS